jgi:hypothetical protein
MFAQQTLTTLTEGEQIGEVTTARRTERQCPPWTPSPPRSPADSTAHGGCSRVPANGWRVVIGCREHRHMVIVDLTSTNHMTAVEHTKSGSV